MNFGEYLISMVGDKKATEILSMNEKEKDNIPIMITGKQGATGKTTLKRELNKRGYLAFEIFERIEDIEGINIVLNKDLPVQIKNFAVDTDEEIPQFWRRFKSEQIPEIEKFMKEKNLTIADIKKMRSLFNNDREIFLISSFEWKSFNKKIADLEETIQSQQSDLLILKKAMENLGLNFGNLPCPISQKQS